MKAETKTAFYGKVPEKQGNHTFNFFNAVEGVPAAPFLFNSVLFLADNQLIYKLFGDDNFQIVTLSPTDCGIFYCYLDLPKKGRSTILFIKPAENQTDLPICYHFGQIVTPAEIVDQHNRDAQKFYSKN